MSEKWRKFLVTRVLHRCQTMLLPAMMSSNWILFQHWPAKAEGRHLKLHTPMPKRSGGMLFSFTSAGQPSWAQNPAKRAKTVPRSEIYLYLAAHCHSLKEWRRDWNLNRNRENEMINPNTMEHAGGPQKPYAICFSVTIFRAESWKESHFLGS